MQYRPTSPELLVQHADLLHDGPAEEVSHQRGHLIDFFLKCEVSRIQEVYFSLWQLFGEGSSSFDGKYAVILAPSHECRRLMGSEVLLPLCIHVKVSLRVVEIESWMSLLPGRSW